MAYDRASSEHWAPNHTVCQEFCINISPVRNSSIFLPLETVEHKTFYEFYYAS